MEPRLNKRNNTFYIALVICVILPLSLIKYPTAISLFLIGFFLFQFFLLKNNLSLLLFLAILAFVPEKTSDDATGIEIFTLLNRFSFYFPIFLALYKGVLAEKSRLFYDTKIWIVLLFALNLIWSLVNNDFAEFSLMPKYLLLISCMFLFYKTNISRTQFYDTFDAITIVYGTYLLVEFFFRWTPYADFLPYGTDGIDNIIDAFRPNGPIGNPLLSGTIFLFEVCFICCRYIETKKINYIILGLTFVFSLATISKTPILGSILLIILALLINTKMSGRAPLKLFIFVFLLVVLVLSVSSTFLTSLLDRLTDLNSDISTQFRIGTYDIAVRVFTDHPFGLGITNLFEIIDSQYANDSWINNFRTLDNVFLDKFVAYGILAICPLAVLFLWIKHTYAYRKVSSVVPCSMYVFFLTVVFISFIFNWEGYNILLVIVGFYAGLNYRDLKKASLLSGDILHNEIV